MRIVPHKKKLWDYLDSVGVLVNGTDSQIKAAKKEYRKKYLLEFKRKQRARDKEFTVKFSKGEAEYETIIQGAKNHSLTVPAFLRASAIAYIRQAYIIPNRLQIAQLEQLLASCLNEIQSLIKGKNLHQFQRDQKFDAIEHRIEKLEIEIRQTLSQPIPIEEFLKKAIYQEPKLKERLLTLLTSSP